MTPDHCLHLCETVHPGAKRHWSGGFAHELRQQSSLVGAAMLALMQPPAPTNGVQEGVL
jgi:hypothetical protein